MYELLRACVAAAVGELAARIEHVGSTSVPGLAAKPVIDIDVLLCDSADLSEATRRLEAMGYQHEGEKGIAGRHAFRATDESDVWHHLYACLPESPEFARHVALRDYLRAHPDDARRYGTLKTQLAARFPHDIEGYAGQARARARTDRARGVGIIKSPGTAGPRALRMHPSSARAHRRTS